MRVENSWTPLAEKQPTKARGPWTFCGLRRFKGNHELVEDPYQRIWLFCIRICLLSTAYYCMSAVWPINLTKENLFQLYCSHWSFISSFNLFTENVFIYFVDILCLEDFSKRTPSFPMDSYFDWSDVFWICPVSWSILWDDDFRNSNFVGLFI